jgi:hypothetical protein
LGTHGANYAVHDIEMVSARHLPEYYNAIRNCDVSKIIANIRNNADFPPLYEQSAAALLLLTGKSWVMMNLLNNMFYLFILLAAIYLLGSALFDRTTGLIAVVLISAHPFSFSIFRRFSLDFSLTAVVTLSIFFLFKSDLLRIRKWSIFFAVSSGIGMLIKEPFAAFLIGPVSYCAITALINSQDRTFRLKNIALVAAIAFLIMSPYYFNVYNLKHAIQRPLSENQGVPLLSRNDINAFTSGIVKNFLGLQYSPILLLGVLPFIKIYRKDAGKIVLLWVIIPIIMVLLMPHWKSYRYVLPLLPALMIISASGMRVVIEKWYGKLLFVVIVGISVSCTVEILSGMPANRDIAAFAFNYTDALRSSELIIPISEERRSAAIFKSLADAVRNRARKHKEPVVFIPFRCMKFGNDFYLKDLLWFNDMPKIKQYALYNEDSKYFFRELGNKMNGIDFMICGTCLSRDGTGRITFYEVQQSMIWGFGRTGAETAAESETIWNGLMKTFNHRELIYRDEALDYWLYSKETN